ncbi:hypothetical protein IW141_004197, partial [Coemansia sp. RSA 355]
DGDDDSSASKSSTKRNPEDDGNAPTILSDRLRETDTFDKDSSNSDSSASNSDKNNDDHDASDVSNSSESGKGGKKLKGGQIAAIVICLILFFILAAVGGYYGLRWYREYRIKRWSPDAVREILDSHIVESEMGNAPQPRFDLPSYGNHRGTMFVAAAGIAVGVSVLVIILLVFVVRWVLMVTRKQQEEKYWDNEMENMKSVRSLGQHRHADSA